jgi:hypothetical protein
MVKILQARREKNAASHTLSEAPMETSLSTLISSVSLYQTNILGKTENQCFKKIKSLFIDPNYCIFIQFSNVQLKSFPKFFRFFRAE